MIIDQIEIIILREIFHNEKYARKVLPFIEPEYFSEAIEKIIFEKIKEYASTYNSIPTKEAILISVDKDDKISQHHIDDMREYIKALTKSEEEHELQWLLDQTEEWCKERAIYNAVVDVVQIIEDKNKQNGQVPKLLQDALSVSFDPNIGHDYTQDIKERLAFYHEKTEKFPFDIDYLNKITKGGVERKTINILLAGTGVGKSLAMCHFASSYISEGLNVLYITLEMAEKKIAARIDANLLDVKMQELYTMDEARYLSKVENLKTKVPGRLMIREYPTASANANHFRHLLDELALKKSFKPDVIFIDYLNIAASTRVKNSEHSYTYAKSIAEELRGLAVEYNVAVWSATQVNRSGFKDSDFGLESTSESFGIPATADFMCALISTEELDELGQIVVKQLKNRYGGVDTYKRFLVGIDRPKMRLYDLEENAQKDLHDYVAPKKRKKKEEDDVPAFDRGSCGSRLSAERKDSPGMRLDREMFGNIK